MNGLPGDSAHVHTNVTRGEGGAAAAGEAAQPTTAVTFRRSSSP